MSERYRSKETTVDMSMMNLVDLPVGYLSPWPTEVSILLAKASGYDGIQFVSTRVTDAQVKTHTLTRWATNNINSAAEGFRSEDSWKKAKEHSNPSLAKPAYIAFPHMDTTRETLAILQTTVAREIPVSLQGPEEATLCEGITNKTLILTPEYYKQLGATSIEDFIAKVEALGFDARLCIDPYQLRRTPPEITGDPFGEWLTQLPQLLENAGLVNVSLGRNELPGTNFDTMAELKDVLNNTRNSQIFDIFNVIREHYVGPIVIQAPARAIYQAMGLQRTIPGTHLPLLLPNEFIQAQRVIANNIKAALQG